MKFSRLILRGIYNKGVGEEKCTINFLKTIIKKKPRAYHIIHIFFDTVHPSGTFAFQYIVIVWNEPPR